MTEPVVGVVCALRSEARHLGRSVPRLGEVQALGPRRLRAVCGIGPAAAAAAASALIARGATALASFGMAGALDPGLQSGAIFLPRLVRGETGAPLDTDPRWHGAAADALAGAAVALEGSLVSVAAPVTGCEAKARLGRDSGARAVDMESFAVARVAAAHARPFLALRVIIDAADLAVPAAALATTASGEVSVPGVLAGLARRPRELGPLLRLARAYGRAGRGLAAVAASRALEYPA